MRCIVWEMIWIVLGSVWGPFWKSCLSTCDWIAQHDRYADEVLQKARHCGMAHAAESLSTNRYAIVFLTWLASLSLLWKLVLLFFYWSFRGSVSSI